MDCSRPTPGADSTRAFAIAVLMLLAGSAWGFEDGARVEYVDAGVHVPVLTKAPELKTFVEAQYPDAAREKGLAAAVKMLITIGADGLVGDVQVTGPAGDGFDEAAVAAVKQFVFTPAEVDFTPSPVQIEYVYNFVLTEVPDAGAELSDAGVPLAANAKLEGQLFARGSRGFVPGALIRCDNVPERETYSTEEGRFSLELPAGECEVRVVASNFETFRTREPLEPNETKEVKYYVLPRVDGLQTIVRDTKERKEVVRRTVTRDEVQKIPGTFGDPLRVIQNFPGVARAPFGLGQLIVRGANPNQTLTFFDGVQIPLLFHLGGGPSVVNSEFLDKIDFFPGGFGARYGRAVGGVVDVSSRKGASDTWHGVAKVDLLDASLFVEAPITKDVSVAVAARRSYVDALLPVAIGIFQSDTGTGGTINILPAYWDYQLRVDVGGKKGQKLEDGQSTFSVFAFGSDDTLKVVATGGGRNRDVTVTSQTTFHRLLANWSFRSGDTTFKLTPYLGFDLANVSFGPATLAANQYTVGVRADLGIDVNEWFKLRAGADIYNQTLVGDAELPLLGGTQYVDFPGADPQVGTQKIHKVLNQFDGALYAEGDITVGDFTATPGVRISQALINGHPLSAVDPRLWLRYQLFEGTALKGSVGLYTQPPASTSVLDPPFGNPELVHEKAFQTSLGVSQKITELINVDVTGFYNRRYDNVVSPGTTTVNPDGTTTETLSANLGLGRAYGMEVMLRHEFSKRFFGWVAYTLNRSEVRRAGSGQDYQVATFDQTHILTVVASYKLPFGFQLGARFRYVTGRPKAGLVHDFDLFDADSNSYRGTYTSATATRYKDFHQLDVRLDKEFVFPSWTLDLYLDVQNVYNQQNVEATIYDYRFRKEYDVPGIPILPVLGIKASL